MLENKPKESNYPVIFPEFRDVCELVGANDIGNLEGKLKTYIDSLGLSEKQEKAMKDVVNEIIWDWFYYIRDHFTDYTQDKRDWYFENRPRANISETINGD